MITMQNTPVAIRLMKHEDYDAVYALWTSTDGMGLRSLDDSKDGVEKFLARNPYTNFVACNGDTIVGVVLSGHDGRRGYIYHAAVGIPHRGQGIGKRLVDTALDALRNEGINKVALVVFENNTIGNDFWQKVGFDARPDLVYRNRSINERNC